MVIRTLVFREDGEIRRIPKKISVALWDGQSSLPEFAGQRVRWATVVLELQDRKPHRILRVDYLRIGFDSNGHLDRSELTERMRIAGAMFEPIDEPKDILDELRPSLAKLRNETKYRWKPTAEETEKLRVIVMAG
jgi:hypothetical protein